MYSPSKRKKRGEDKATFSNRVRNEAISTRSVKVSAGKHIDFGVDGPIMLKQGEMWLVSAEVRGGMWGKHYILFAPDLKNLMRRSGCFLRIDSGCMSGVVFGDSTCDCLHQLRQAQDIILEEGGIIVHIPNQDGRGWQDFKMANQRLMHDLDINTIDAAVKFYGDKDLIDSRTYDECTFILKALGFPEKYEFTVGTRNRSKIDALRNAGFNVKQRPVDAGGLHKTAVRNLSAKYKHWNLPTQETT